MNAWGWIAVALFAASAGFYFGGRYRVSIFRSLIQRRARSHYLGNLIQYPEERAACTKAYFEPDTILDELPRLVWDVPVVPAPFVGYAPKLGTWKQIQINSNHFRSSNEVSIPKREQTVRGFLVGGSTAFGTGASIQEHSPGGYLKAMLGDWFHENTDLSFELFTAACPGWSSTHERIIIENVISEMQPDLVISLTGFNDLHWAWNRKNVLWFRSYADTFFWRMLQSAMTLGGGDVLDDPLRDWDKPPTQERAREVFMKNVRLAHQALQPLNCGYWVALQPHLPVSKKALSEREHRRRNDWHPDQLAYFQEAYRGMWEDLEAYRQTNENFHAVDLSGLFNSDSERDEVFLDAAHFGDRGYRRIAEGLYLAMVPQLAERYLE